MILKTKNIKTLLREIKDLNKWTDTPCSRFRRIEDGVRMAIHSRLIHGIMSSQTGP
jgi:hypothetical protein